MNVQPISINTSFQAKQPIGMETLNKAKQHVAELQNRIIGIRNEINRKAGIHAELKKHQPNETVDQSVRIDMENAWAEIFGALGAAMPMNIPEDFRIFINRIKNYAQNNGYKHLPIKDDALPKNRKLVEQLNILIDKWKAQDLRKNPSEGTNKKGV